MISLTKNAVNNIILGVLVIVLVYLFFQRDILDNSVSPWMFALPLWIYMVCVPYEYIAYSVALIFPLSFGLSTGYIYLLAIVLLMIKGKKYDLRSLSFVLAIIILEFLHYPFYTFNPDVQLGSYINYFSSIFFLAFFFNNVDRKVDPSLFALSFCVGTAILTGFIVWHTATLDVSTILSGNVRIGDEAINDTIYEEGTVYLRANANSLAYYSIASISMLVVLMFRKSVNRIFALLLIIVCAFGGLLTISRTWLLSAALMVFLFLLPYRRNKWSFLIFVLLLALFVYVVQVYLVDVTDRFSARFDSGDMATGGNRTDLFSEYNKRLFEDSSLLIFGGGAFFYRTVFNIWNSTHNAIQQIFVCYGIVGGVLLLTPFVSKVVKHYNAKKGTFIYIIPMIMCVVFLQTLQILNPWQMMYPLIPAFLIMTMSKEESIRVK